MTSSIWKTTTLGEIVDVKGGKRLPKGKTVLDTPTPYRYIRVQDFNGFSVDVNKVKYIDREAYEAVKRYAIFKDEVIISIVGSIGFVGKVPEVLSGSILTENAAKLVVLDNRVVCSTYLMYYLRSEYGQNEIYARIVGSTQPKLPLYAIKEIKIPLPPIEIQNKIVEIVGSLDDKIELNRRMNETLEQMAMALYKHWFGEGEQEVKFSEIIEINPAVHIKKGAPVPFVDMKALPTTSMSVQREDIVKKPFTSGSRFMKNDILFARITPCLENGKTAFVDFLKDSETGFGSTEFLVFRAKHGCCPQFVYCLARDEQFRQYAIKSMVGTSGRQRVQIAAINEYLLVKPDPELMEKFDKVTKDWFEQIKSNVEEISELIKIRDYLLPRLLSGEIEVKEAEEQVEEVLANA